MPAACAFSSNLSVLGDSAPVNGIWAGPDIDGVLGPVEETAPERCSLVGPSLSLLVLLARVIPPLGALVVKSPKTDGPRVDDPRAGGLAGAGASPAEARAGTTGAGMTEVGAGPAGAGPAGAGASPAGAGAGANPAGRPGD